MDRIPVYTDTTTGECMLCMMFYEYMRYRRKGVSNFAEAITRLETISEETPVYDQDRAIVLVQWAINFVYSGSA